MDDDTAEVLMQVAGFLKVIAEGHITVPEHARKEAAELLEKISNLDWPLPDAT